MPNTDVSQAILTSQQLTVQQSARRDAETAIFPVQWLARAGEVAPPWWSTMRDRWLREFWKSSDHLSGAIYTLVSKMTAIPVKVVPKDMSDRRAIQAATVLTDIINDAPGFGKGWAHEYGKFVEDLVSQDNGGFMEVVGAGDKTGPIEGPVISLVHLDAARCTRTGNAEFPVIYTDLNGKRYKLHFSRVIEASQMPSPIEEMHGVGFSAVSRSIGVAQNLIDIVIYKQEKLGSRPLREVLITKGGLDPQDVAEAFTLAESQMDSMALKRYSKVIVAGSRTIPDGEVIRVPLSDLPDGFDEQMSITMAMATIALAFGMDARELFPALTSGATRADALLQHLKQRGKGPGQILQITERNMNFKVMPSNMRFMTDFQDDAQDRQTAEIAMVRANRRVQDAATGASTDRIMRERMVVDGDVTQEQFDAMELEDGRLPNGTPSEYLFFSKDPEYSQYLKIPGVDNPLDVIQNDHERVLSAIYDNLAKVADVMVNISTKRERNIALQCQSALNKLEDMYSEPTFIPGDVPVNAEDQGQSQGMVGRPPKPGSKRIPGKQYVDPRNRRIDTTTPKLADESNNLGNSDNIGE